MLRAILIDDESNALKMLTLTLNKYCPEVIIVEKSNDPFEGLELVQQNDFDILFLDIQMPGMTGFQLLKKLDNINFEVIFITAYDQYAIEAFKFNASNYLLKPIDENDLIKAIDKVKVSLQSEQNKIADLLNKINNEQDINSYRISIPFADGLEFVNVMDIIYCKSESNYTHIYLKDNTQRLVSKTMKYIESKLPPSLFFRAHNSYIVNLKFVKKYFRKDGSYLEMVNGDVIRLSRNKKDEILDLL